MLELIIIVILSIACIISGVELIKTEKENDNWRRLYDLRKETERIYWSVVNGEISKDVYNNQMTQIRMEAEQIEEEIN